jgi:hypothetical protein
MFNILVKVMDGSAILIGRLVHPKLGQAISDRILSPYIEHRYYINNRRYRENIK